jgi:hypothetical protein
MYAYTAGTISRTRALKINDVKKDEGRDREMREREAALRQFADLQMVISQLEDRISGALSATRS